MVASILGVLALAIPALAADPRCEVRPDRPQCQLGGETPAPTTTTSTTASEQEPTTTLPSPENPLDAVSVIGCSNTNHAVSGYLETSDTDLLVNTAWAGHTVEYWALRTEGWVEHYLPLRPEDADSKVSGSTSASERRQA